MVGFSDLNFQLEQYIAKKKILALNWALLTLNFNFIPQHVWVLFWWFFILNCLGQSGKKPINFMFKYFNCQSQYHEWNLASKGFISYLN